MSATVDLCGQAIEKLRGGNVVLGEGEIDYAVAGLLEALVGLHEDLTIDLDAIRELDDVLELLLEGSSS